MLKKLMLDRSNMYQRKIAVEEIADMLINFTRGYSYNLSIGSEQGFDQWDDIVILSNDNKYIYVQAKRQTTPFSTDSITRGVNKNGKLQDTSPLDKAFISLGKWVNTDASINGCCKLILPDGSIEIKDKLNVWHLINFKDQIKDGITTIQGLTKLVHEDHHANDIFCWLTSWCDFKDLGHILRAFNHLEFSTCGLESDIESRTKKTLENIFKESKIDQVYSLILSYTEENSRYTGAIKPRQLLFLLKDFLLPSIPHWTLFQSDGESWGLSGINDIEKNDCIERPFIIVPKFWSNNTNESCCLKVYGNYIDECKLSEGLARLLIHTSSTILCSDNNNWLEIAKSKTGGTLGISQSDCSDLIVKTGLEYTKQCECLAFNSINKSEDYAIELDKQMNLFTFGEVEKQVSKLITKLVRGTLREDVENRWNDWKKELGSNDEKIKDLFCEILHPKSEGNSIHAHLRIGSKTVKLISKSLFLMLIVSVCLSDNYNQGWNSVRNDLRMRSIGLAFWSGPADGMKKVVEIDDESGFRKLLTNESEQILIIPQSTLSDKEAFDEDLTGYNTKLDLLSYPNYPKLLITCDRNFKRLLTKGDMSEIKDYLQKRLIACQSSMQKAIDKISNGVA